MRATLLLAALAAACTSGPGRPPVFPDAAARHDAGTRDADPAPDAVIDAGVPDSEVVLFDSGIPPAEFPFTGQWQIDGDQNRLYAREVRGQLAVMIGGAPYVYTGTIDEAGNVNLVSPRLARSGCAEPTLIGSFQRRSAVPFLTHKSCGANGPFTASITGGFELDYASDYSGIYRVVAVVMADDQNCTQGNRGPFEMFWGVNIGPIGNVISIFTGVDVVSETAVYIGRLELPDMRFAAIESLFAQPGGTDMTMRGTFTRVALEAPRVTGSREIYDAVRNCTFAVGFEAEKVSDF